MSWFKKKPKTISTRDLFWEIMKIHDSRFVSIYCDFNCWKWPVDIEHIKPDWWEDEIITDRHISLVTPILDRLQNYVSREDTSREHVRRNPIT